MDITELETLCQALNSLFKPNVDNAVRLEALKLYESYKDDAKCAKVGFYLANNASLPSNVQHYGLILIKHRVRMYWTSMKQEEQLAIKTQLLSIISSCSNVEPHYIKTMLATILNELVKHVWPQNWPTMQDEIINQFCSGDNMTTIEIVIIMFQNLAEDVVIFENIATRSRARDLRKALSVASPDIVTLLLKVLREHAVLAESIGTSVHSHFVELCVTALEGYIGWIASEVLFMEKGILFETLFSLFETETFQGVAAECFLIAVSRRGPMSERLVLMKLTDDCFVEKYASAIKYASRMEGFNQARFHFLHTISKVISSLCNLLIGIWEDKSQQDNEGRPCELGSRKNFLEVLFHLTSHDSICISFEVVQSWNKLLQHKHIRDDPTLLKLLPLLIDLASQFLSKDFSKKNLFSTFEEAELNDDEEITTILQKNRGFRIEFLRFCTIVAPLETLKKCYEYTELQLSTKHESAEAMNFQYDSMFSFLDVVMNSIVEAAEKHKIINVLPITLTENLLQTFLSRKPDDPVTLQTFMSCAYCLCKLLCLSCDPQIHFKLFLDYLFALLDESSYDVQTCVNKLRINTCIHIVRMAKFYPKVMVSLASHLKSFVQDRINQTPSKFSQTEKVYLLEALVLISMEWKNVAQQSNLISDIMKTTMPVTQSTDFVAALTGPEEFSKRIGMGIVPPDVLEARLLPSGQLRSDIYYYTHLSVAILNRIQDWKPPETDSAAKNPCSAHLGEMFDHVLNLVYVLTAMWCPASRSFVHSENLKALDIKECERKELIFQSKQLGAEKNNTDEKPKLYWEQLQNFLVGRLDCCYQILGLVGKILGPSFYLVNGLQQVCSVKVLSNIEFLSVIRLRSLFRQFLCPFFKHCPDDLVSTVLSPLLQRYCQFVMTRLQPAWESFSQKEGDRLRGCDDDSSDEKEEQEILDEQILRMLTREHLDLLISLCVNKHPPPCNGKHSTENDASTQVGEDIAMKSVDGGKIVQLTSLGSAITATVCGESVLTSALISLSWHDTTSCYKAVQLLWPLLKLLTQNQSALFDEAITKFVLQAILSGLKAHGQHMGCEAQLSSLALMVIQALKPFHENTIASVIFSTMRQKNLGEVQNFLTKFDSFNEKKRRAQFKNLVKEIIDQHVGQQFKVIPEMEIFAPLFIQRRQKIEKEATYEGLSSLFNP